MVTVKNFEDIKTNIDVLENYLNSNVDPEYSFALELIKKGTCFVTLKVKDVYKFYPSRFVGYINNSMDAHSDNKSKDGRVTNSAITKMLQCKPYQNKDLDKLYIQYCESLGFIANEKGSFGVVRKYWEF